MLKKVFPKKGKVCKATFSLPKQATTNAKQVVLLGEFNDWDKTNPFKMTKKKDGSYSATIELETGRSYQFRYLIDNSKWENDWAADQYIPVSAYGIDNSVIEVPEVLDVKTQKVTAKKTKTKNKKDDLKKIEGVGPKISTLLAEGGFETFEKLSKAKVKDLKAILLAAGSRYKIHNPTTWPKQAKLAANGEWEKLKKLQDALNGGVA